MQGQGDVVFPRVFRYAAELFSRAAGVLHLVRDSGTPRSRLPARCARHLVVAPLVATHLAAAHLVVARGRAVLAAAGDVVAVAYDALP